MRLSFDFSNVLGSVYHRGSIKFGPDGSSLFSPVGNKIIMYDLKGSKSSSLPLQLNYNVEHLCVHPKGTILLASSEKSHLYMISLLRGRLLHIKEYKSFSKITHLSFSPDGRYYCVCGENLALIYITPGSIIVGKGREITPFRLLRKFRINHDIISDVCWTEDSNHICIASRDISLNIISLHDQGRNIVNLKGHSDSIVNCYFTNASLESRQLFSLAKNCQLFVWSEKELDADDPGENDSQLVKKVKKSLRFFRSAKHYLRPPAEQAESKQENLRRSTAYVTASDYNYSAKLLVIGYNYGHYSLYEMPNANLIYSLNSDSGLISSISINSSGDWIAFGSSIDAEVDINKASNKTQSRLLVWEWQSKSHVLDHTGTGASMHNVHECVSYSLDGTHIVSGNLAGRIKVWSGLTGETVAIFGEEHSGPIKSIKFVPNKSGKVIISASLDGTLRAYDLNKYRNFRTFQSPIDDKKPEFICLDVDSTGEFIAAGTYNYFEIYLYSLQTGKFLEYLTGHEGPVSGLAFSPMSNLLVSSSWDCTIKIWNLFEGSKCVKETITMSHEVITVTFRPDGNQFAASMSNGHIALFDPYTSEQQGASIEGAGDLGTTQLITEISRDTKKYFISLNYSADGSYLIAAGKSNYICIYHTREKMLVKKIPMTFNMSMDGIFDYVSNRRRKEFGYNLELLDQRKEEKTSKPIQLPGVRRGDLGERQAKAVISVYQIVFSPTMRQFAAATTEGVLVYSRDVNLNFNPYQLSADVDPFSIHQALNNGDYGVAIVQSIQLNDRNLLKEAIEKVPLGEMETIINGLESNYARMLLDFIGNQLADSKHIEFYLNWIKSILYRHGMNFKDLPLSEITPVVRSVHQNVHRLFMDLKRNCDYSRYSLEFLTKNLDLNVCDQDADDELIMRVETD